MKKLLVIIAMLSMIVLLQSCAQLKSIATPENVIAGVSVKKQIGDIGEIYQNYVVKYGGQAVFDAVKPEFEQLQATIDQGKKLSVNSALTAVVSRAELKEELKNNVLVLRATYLDARQKDNVPVQPNLELFYKDLVTLNDAFDAVEDAAAANEIFKLIMTHASRLLILL